VLESSCNLFLFVWSGWSILGGLIGSVSEQFRFALKLGLQIRHFEVTFNFPPLPKARLKKRSSIGRIRTWNQAHDSAVKRWRECPFGTDRQSVDFIKQST
jgi:hypothetical protein